MRSFPEEKVVQYCCQVESPALIFVYALFAFLTGKKLIVFGEKDPGLPKFLARSIVFKKDDIATYPGKWYRLQREMVEESQYLKKMNLEDNLVIRFQCKIFNSGKAVNFYKQWVSHIEYKLLRDMFLTKQLDDPLIFLMPYLKPYGVLAECYLDKKEYVTSRFLALLFILAGGWTVLKKVCAGLLFEPVFCGKLKARLLKRLGWGFGKFDLTDDMLVDHKTIFPGDMLFFTDKGTGKGWERSSCEQAKRLNYRVLEVGNEINVNDRLWKHLKNNVCLALPEILYSFLFCPHLLFALSSFHDKAAYNYKLYSFCDVPYQWSLGIWHDIAETVIANDCGSRMFVYHWADSAQCYAYGIALTVQNDLFLWGPVMTRLQHKKSQHDNFYCIGCLFANSYPKTPREVVLQKLGLSADKPVVVFYDSPPNDAARFSQREFDGFVQLVRDFALARRDVQVVLKPKEVAEWYRNYFKDTPVKLVDAMQVGLTDIVWTATLNVGIGIVAPVVVGLIMDQPGIFFDTGGNYDSPLAKHEGTLVFRDKQSVLNKIDEYLRGDAVRPEVPELEDYNVPNVDPLDVLRQYIKTGRVDEKYRLGFQKPRQALAAERL